MARVLISLIGGRPLPNILGVLHLNPDYLYLVASQDSMGKDGNCQKAVDALRENVKVNLRGVYSVKPYTPQSTIRICQQIFNHHVKDEVIICTASEPKPMGFGAYDIVKDLRTEGFQVELCYLTNEGLIWLFRDYTESVTIDISTYFASYGWTIQNKVADEKLKKFVSVFQDQVLPFQRLLNAIRKPSQGKDKRSCKLNKPLDDSLYVLFQKAEALGIISKLQRDKNCTSWTINSQEDSDILLGGDWLEYSVYKTASELKDKQGKPLFEECSWGVEDQGNKGEIDFVGIRGGQLVIASCKTTDKVERKWFEELRAKAERLGGRMCSCLFVSSVLKSTRKDHDMNDIKRWSEEFQIVPVFAEDLFRLDVILRKIALANSNMEPDDITCYPRI
jgi:hypothetical protein